LQKTKAKEAGSADGRGGLCAACMRPLCGLCCEKHASLRHAIRLANGLIGTFPAPGRPATAWHRRLEKAAVSFHPSAESGGVILGPGRQVNNPFIWIDALAKL
jgi:hypothetical protein